MMANWRPDALTSPQLMLPWNSETSMPSTGARARADGGGGGGRASAAVTARKRRSVRMRVRCASAAPGARRGKSRGCAPGRANRRGRSRTPGCGAGPGCVVDYSAMSLSAVTKRGSMSTGTSFSRSSTLFTSGRTTPSFASSALRARAIAVRLRSS